MFCLLTQFEMLMDPAGICASIRDADGPSLDRAFTTCKKIISPDHGEMIFLQVV